MQPIGKIKHVQIQREPLKRGERPDRYYDPSPLLTTDSLRLTAQGIYGEMSDGGSLIDVHHVQHPRSRNRGNANGISFSFTVHYDRMRATFGDHVTYGCAGENILIEAEDDFDFEQIGSRIGIKTTDGTIIRLGDIMVAAPCAEFSRWIAKSDITGEKMREVLEFLSDGTRGYYATLEIEQNEPLVTAGDAVLLLD